MRNSEAEQENHSLAGQLGESGSAPPVVVPPKADPEDYLPRVKQVNRDRYYMGIARAVAKGANCTGKNVGAVLVRDNRVVSTGVNGTPSGFPNCRDGGCVRCRDRALQKADRLSEISDPDHASAGKALDVCICVHAEANALLAAAKFGIPIDGSTLYTTLSPCFGCLKEAIQAGVERIVYDQRYDASYSAGLRKQYEELAEHLRANNPRNFESVGDETTPVADEGQPDAYESASEAVTNGEPVADEEAS